MSGGAVRLVVSDTGIGMAEEDVPRVFQLFEQLDSRLARRHAGSGLGLPLVKALTELHGGTVSVTSKVGKGTTIVVELPPERVVPTQMLMTA
jgi:two-component system cell cycle sensor histidine kinase PleC